MDEKKIKERKTRKTMQAINDAVLDRFLLESPVRWFYRTAALHEEMTPDLAQAAALIIKSSLEPKSTSASPATCSATLRLIEGALKRRRSERIMAKEARDAEAKEAANMASGQARAAFRLSVAARPPKRQRSVDNYGRTHVF